MNEYPFLSQSCGVEVEDGRVKELYKHVISVECNSLAFIGLPR